MPNLTPIALSEEEHRRLTSIKHKLEASSWREMLTKLCDIYDGLCQTDQPILATEETIRPIVEKIIEEKLTNNKDAAAAKPKPTRSFLSILLNGKDACNLHKFFVLL
jgi:hypothetical protein